MLKSKKAIEVNIKIKRVFVSMHKFSSKIRVFSENSKKYINKNYLPMSIITLFGMLAGDKLNKKALKKIKNNYISIIITLFVVGVLVLIGPSSLAYTFDFITEFSNSNPIHGEIINIKVQFEVEEGEIINPSPLYVYINELKPQHDNYYCAFDHASGIIINGTCNGINVSVDNLYSKSEDTGNLTHHNYTGYGYGYSYTGPGTYYGFPQGTVITYNLSINTSYFSYGENNLTVRMQFGDDQNVLNSTKKFTIGVALNTTDPMFDGVGFLRPPGEDNMEDISYVKVNNEWSINIETEGKNSTITLPIGTKINTTSGDNLNLSNFISKKLNESEIDLLGIDDVENAIRFGIPGYSLSFDPAINLSIYVGVDDAGSSVKIQRSLDGENWIDDGITPTSCIIDDDGYCNFQTTMASYFAVYDLTEPTTPPTPTDDTVTSTGGGSVPDIVRISDAVFEEGYSRSMTEGQGIRFNVKNEQHLLLVSEITDTAASIVISSEPQTRTLRVGEEWEVNVNNDNFLDLLVTLEDISGVRARVNIRKINKEIIEDVIGEDVIDEIDTEPVDDGAIIIDIDEDDEEETQRRATTGLTGIVTDFVSEGRSTVGFIVLILIVCAGVVFSYYRSHTVSGLSKRCERLHEKASRYNREGRYNDSVRAMKKAKMLQRRANQKNYRK